MHRVKAASSTKATAEIKGGTGYTTGSLVISFFDNYVVFCSKSFFTKNRHMPCREDDNRPPEGTYENMAAAAALCDVLRDHPELVPTYIDTPILKRWWAEHQEADKRRRRRKNGV